MKTISQHRGQNWHTYHADCMEAIKALPHDSIDFSIFSPPFASLYTYSNSERDLGNCRNIGEFLTHFDFLIPELFRITKPGRLLSFHCMNIPTLKHRDGFIGIQDFRGMLIQRFQSHDWIYASEVCIWKDPVTAMQRTKSLRLLHKQLAKDSALAGQGLPDYVVTMRKPGENAKPIAGELTYFCGDKSTFQPSGRLSIDIWQRYASPVWMDINQSNTLQFRSVRENEDERHICPLQLDVIERCLQLWSMPGEVVFSPFMGIGSEGVVAIRTDRRFIGIELKESYYKQAVANLQQAETDLRSQFLFKDQTP